MPRPFAGTAGVCTTTGGRDDAGCTPPECPNGTALIIPVKACAAPERNSGLTAAAVPVPAINAPISVSKKTTRRPRSRSGATSAARAFLSRITANSGDGTGADCTDMECSDSNRGRSASASSSASSESESRGCSHSDRWRGSPEYSFHEVRVAPERQECAALELRDRPNRITHALATSKLKLTEGAGRAVAGEFNGERIVGRAWPAVENRVVFLELHQ